MDYQAARKAMIDSQIRTGNVTQEAIIAAFSETPREIFLPSRLQNLAYCDRALEIEKGKFLMDPMALARLIQSLEIDSAKKVLVVGMGTGYAAAILARIGGTIVALDSDEKLVEQAEANFRQLQIKNVTVAKGALKEGFAKHAPYDAILVDGATDDIPNTWFDQLAENGRLAVIVNEKGIGKAKLFEKNRNHIGQQMLFDAWAPTLPGLQQSSEFVFV